MSYGHPVIAAELFVPTLCGSYRISDSYTEMKEGIV